MKLVYEGHKNRTRCSRRWPIEMLEVNVREEVNVKRDWEPSYGEKNYAPPRFKLCVSITIYRMREGPRPKGAIKPTTTLSQLELPSLKHFVCLTSRSIFLQGRPIALFREIRVF